MFLMSIKDNWEARIQSPSPAQPLVPYRSNSIEYRSIIGLRVRAVTEITRATTSLPLKQGGVSVDGFTGVSKGWSECSRSLVLLLVAPVSGVYGRKVSLLLLISSLESLLGPAMAVTSAHKEGAAVSQVGCGGAVTECAVSKSGNWENV